MKYKSVVNLIRTAALAVAPDGAFIHGRRSDASIQYGDSMPQIHLYPINVRKDNDDNVRSIILMSFLDQDSVNSSNEQREDIIDTAETIADAFIGQIRTVSGVSIEGQVEMEPLYRTMQGTLSGYAVRFTLLSKTECPPECTDNA